MTRDGERLLNSDDDLTQPGTFRGECVHRILKSKIFVNRRAKWTNKHKLFVIVRTWEFWDPKKYGQSGTKSFRVTDRGNEWHWMGQCFYSNTETLPDHVSGWRKSGFGAKREWMSQGDKRVICRVLPLPLEG